MKELLVLIGLDGFAAVRADDCSYGAPYQKGQIWVGNTQGLASIATTCNHPGRHPDPLHGIKTRRSALYPRELVTKLVAGVVDELHAREQATLGVSCSADTEAWLPSRRRTS